MSYDGRPRRTTVPDSDWVPGTVFMGFNVKITECQLQEKREGMRKHWVVHEPVYVELDWSPSASFHFNLYNFVFTYLISFSLPFSTFSYWSFSWKFWEWIFLPEWESIRVIFSPLDWDGNLYQEHESISITYGEWSSTESFSCAWKRMEYISSFINCKCVDANVCTPIREF